MCFTVLLLFSSPIHRNNNFGKILEDFLLISFSQPPCIWKDGAKNICLSSYLIRELLLR